ncbi:hypothetical protein pb186bvf_013993 [Paramecium bursaria]
MLINCCDQNNYYSRILNKFKYHKYQKYKINSYEFSKIKKLRIYQMEVQLSYNEVKLYYIKQNIQNIILIS